MKIAVTGGTGFVGGRLARQLAGEGHEVVIIGRRAGVSVEDAGALAKAFQGCHAVAHCAGINREIGAQSYQRVHVDGTRAVIDAAQRAGVPKIVMLSFLRARPDCGSPYHESKWAAEELIRHSGLDYTILKSGMIYGRGDHMLDHLSHALYTFPLFLTVGLREKPIRPVAVDDVVAILRDALIDERLSRETVKVVGPEEMKLTDAVRRVARVVRRAPLMIPAPVWVQSLLAHVWELTMKVPLAAIAQVRILSEGVAEAAPFASELPEDLRPSRSFTEEQIRAGLPERGAFGWDDLRCCLTP